VIVGAYASLIAMGISVLMMSVLSGTPCKPLVSTWQSDLQLYVGAAMIAIGAGFLHGALMRGRTKRREE